MIRAQGQTALAPGGGQRPIHPVRLIQVARAESVEPFQYPSPSSLIAPAAHHEARPPSGGQPPPLLPRLPLRHQQHGAVRKGGCVVFLHAAASPWPRCAVTRPWGKNTVLCGPRGADRGRGRRLSHCISTRRSATTGCYWTCFVLQATWPIIDFEFYL
jgi:hypothetical protein